MYSIEAPGTLGADHEGDTAFQMKSTRDAGIGVRYDTTPRQLAGMTPPHASWPE
jgi:hypothetical protein